MRMSVSFSRFAFALTLLAACGPGAPRDDADARAEARDDAPADSGPPDDVPTIAPVGLGALTAFERLPYLRTGEYARHAASFDRAGGNADFDSYLGTDAHGDKILLDALGPGCVYLFWVTWVTGTPTVKFYFDGETTPRVAMTLDDFFSGTHAPFLAPLVSNPMASSGGRVSYLPMPFARSLRVTLADPPAMNFYYNVDYHTFASGTAVATWTGHEDAAAAGAFFAHAGSDPKPDTGNATASSVVDLAAGASVTLLDVDGPRSISSIRVGVPGAAPIVARPVTDTGRAFTGSSAFTVALDAANEGAVLVRRMDYSVADQTADVFVGGARVGRWSTPGHAAGEWRDATFELPATATRGHTSLDVRVAFVSSAVDWNEFRYDLVSHVRGNEVASDAIDVGDAASEAAHHYAVDHATWSGSQPYAYPDPGSAAAPLRDLWLRVAYDGEATARVEAPLDALFAVGHFGAGNARGIPAGVASDGTGYLYYPMPFARHATVTLENRGASAVAGVFAEVRHKPFADAFSNVGYFATSYNALAHPATGLDMPFVDVAGTGQVVGVVQSESGLTVASPAWTQQAYLEGDERVVVDGSHSPVIQGTGTEDFYNGAFYFQYGDFTLPTHGSTAHTLGGAGPGVASAWIDSTSMHRFFFADAIPFRSHVRLGVEHGGDDHWDVDAWTLAYYYAQPTPRAVQTDTLDFGDAASVAAHGYAITGQTFAGTLTATFEGEAQGVDVTSAGRAHRGSSEFHVAVDPANRGVLLRRLFDQGVANQRAHVVVDGTAVGDWYTAGVNSSHRWREDDFALPASVTRGRATLDVRIEFVASDVDWNEFRYEVFSLAR